MPASVGTLLLRAVAVMPVLPVLLKVRKLVAAQEEVRGERSLHTHARARAERERERERERESARAHAHTHTHTHAHARTHTICIVCVCARDLSMCTFRVPGSPCCSKHLYPHPDEVGDRPIDSNRRCDNDRRDNDHSGYDRRDYDRSDYDRSDYDRRDYDRRDHDRRDHDRRDHDRRDYAERESSGGRQVSHFPFFPRLHVTDHSSCISPGIFF